MARGALTPSATRRALSASQPGWICRYATCPILRWRIDCWGCFCDNDRSEMITCKPYQPPAIRWFFFSINAFTCGSIGFNSAASPFQQHIVDDEAHCYLVLTSLFYCYRIPLLSIFIEVDPIYESNNPEWGDNPLTRLYYSSFYQCHASHLLC